MVLLPVATELATEVPATHTLYFICSLATELATQGPYI